MVETYVLPLILLFPSLLLFLKILKYSYPSKLPPLPPGPKPWPILGNILQIGKNNPHVTLAEFARSYGPLMLVRLGTQILIVGSSSEAAKEILRTHDKILSGRQVPYATPLKSQQLNYLSLGWALECNDQWRIMRTLLKTELSSTKSLELQASSREEKVAEMVAFLNSTNGKVVELGQVVFPTVFNMLSDMFMSRDMIGYSEDEDGGGMKRLIRRFLEVISSPNLSDIYPIFHRFDLQGLTKKTMDEMEKIWAMWKPIVNERRETRRSKDTSVLQKDFLDTLLDNEFNDEQINHLFLELFTAGTDTSITTIEWVMAELIKNPESLKKAREEIDNLIGEELIPKESHLAELPYLQACVKEALRLHPPGPLLLPHRAIDTCTVMDYTVPENAQVVVNVWAIGRDPEIWEDPLEFRPERFMNSSKATDVKGNDFELLPFGSGRRMCPGIPIATRHVPLVLASLIHCFNWSLPLNKAPIELNMSEKFDITLRKEQPLVLIPGTRKKK